MLDTNGSGKRAGHEVDRRAVIGLCRCLAVLCSQAVPDITGPLLPQACVVDNQPSGRSSWCMEWRFDVDRGNQTTTMARRCVGGMACFNCRCLAIVQFVLSHVVVAGQICPIVDRGHWRHVQDEHVPARSMWERFGHEGGEFAISWGGCIDRLLVPNGPWNHKTRFCRKQTSLTIINVRRGVGVPNGNLMSAVERMQHAWPDDRCADGLFQSMGFRDRIIHFRTCCFCRVV